MPERTGEGGRTAKEKGKDISSWKNRGSQQDPPRMLPKGLLTFLTLVGRDQWLELDGEPRRLVSCILEKAHTRP